MTNGLKIQWSNDEVAANTNVILPINYTSATSYSVQVSIKSSSANNPQFIQIGFRNKTASSFQTGYTNGTPISWFAIGY